MPGKPYLALILLAGAAAPAPPAAMTMDTHPSSQAFEAADERMMSAMHRALTGDADRDFVTGMLPHHQGAVDMARVELQYGKDHRLRRLARDIIAAQEKEIAQMQHWLQQHP